MGNPFDEELDEDYEEYIRQVRRARRRKALRRKRRRQARIRRALFFGTVLVVLIAVLVLVFVFAKGKKEEKMDQKKPSAVKSEAVNPSEATGTYRQETEPASAESAGEERDHLDVTEPENEEQAESNQANSSEDSEHDGDNSRSGSRTYTYEATDSTQVPGGEFVSTNAIFIDEDNDMILAQKDAMSRINPASMTKVLTLLVAVEHIDNLDDSFTITAEATDYGYKNDCSVAGFEKDETVTVRDLLYGTILPSGADATMGLALYVSGSQEAFVELMNEKLQELGLSDTAHFTNCVGIYDENHYCTVYDMAVIMNAAIDNETCREILSAHTYQTSATGQHPEGILLSNWFLRRIEDKDTGGEVLCGKTGFVNQSGNCAVSYGTDQGGRNYICVTVGATSGWRCIYDHVDLYKKFSERT